tara:strand:+ start:18 stop:650 length:633 start_codon:yes stop_codon:yes gene_type:complete
MKKLLLILLCVPMIGFGQVDCGEEPKNPNKFNNGSNNNSPKYRKYKKEFAEWEKCISERMAEQGPVKAESRLGNQWIYDNTLFYEIVFEEDLNIKDGHIDIKITKGLGMSSYLEGATIKVQKKDGRTRVLVYDFEMGSDEYGSGFGMGGGVAFGSSYKQTYSFTNLVFNKRKHRYTKSITMSSFGKAERGIVEAVENRSGASKEILNDDW